MLSDFVKTADWKSEKHVPVITCADESAAGETLEVSVCVGREIPHPNTPTHFIVWIALHFVPDGSNTSIELARCEFGAHGAAADGTDGGPARTASEVKCFVKLNRSGRLFATAYCNIHGLWSSEKAISVK